MQALQSAVDTAVASAEPTRIQLAAGTWRGVLRIPAGAPPIALAGAGMGRTVLVNDHFASRIDPGTGQPFGTFGSATVFVHGNDFQASDMTIANDAGPVGQAVAMVLSGTRAAFRRVRFSGHQDTLYLQGHDSVSWFADCEVEGTVDFIFGSGTALFERCRIHSRGPGYITAASTPAGRRHGLVFQDCDLTADAGVSGVHLGRPWRDHARVAFLHSRIGAHVAAAGWHDWERPERRATAHFAEGDNRGPGASVADRVAWSHRLDAAATAQYTRQAILADWRPYE